ncbi:SDR family NAD(P)-dependent oxidoreductase [Pseudonocardia sp. GCM10023141]|uniref:SDR family NAD(P)-dependent oxidoreductase n=1 Tax=Pseudonocardia sp. GCM10023141 TaxID=3252653 RepID=UPI00361B3655
MSLPQPAAAADVVVTGASSGIGTELASGLARRGHNLVLVARRKERMEALAERLRTEHGVQVTVHARDLGSTAERDALVADLRAGGRTVSGVCNCAGFGTSGAFKDLPLQRERDQVELNVTALLDLTHAFLADMVTAGRGAVLNVASIAGYQPLPTMATYSATKAFVQTFSAAVHEELRGTGVSCTVLCPGPVETEWSEIASADAVMIGPAQVSPRDVAEAGIAGMIAGKRTVVPGLVPKAMSLAGHFTPRSLLLPGLALGRALRGKG